MGLLQPEVVPDADEFFRQHFDEGRQLVDLRGKKGGHPRRPDFVDRSTGLGIWLNQCSQWVLDRLSGRDEEGAIPEKVRTLCMLCMRLDFDCMRERSLTHEVPCVQPVLSVGTSAGQDTDRDPPRTRTVWTEEHGRAIAAAVLGSLEDDATDEADPPEARMHSTSSYTRWHEAACMSGMAHEGMVV